jgi:DNA mismatch repair protein MutS2
MNEMRSNKMEFQQEEMKIWRQLKNKFQDNRENTDMPIATIAQLDLVSARIRLGHLIDGVVPYDGDKGFISLKEAKHPVLFLIKLDNVVGSGIDIRVWRNQGFVLPGPNSSEKIVIFTPMTLCTLMVRNGIPVPIQSNGQALISPTVCLLMKSLLQILQFSCGWRMFHF